MTDLPPTVRRAVVAVLLGSAAGVVLVGPAGCKKEDAPPAATPAAAPRAAAPAGPTYSFESVTFAYPPGWKVQPAADGKLVVVVGPQDGDWEPNVALRTYANPDGKSVDELIGEGKTTVAQKPDFELKEVLSPIDHPGGFKYGRFAYLSKAEGRTEVGLAHWYVVVPLPDHRWLQIQASAPAESRAKYDPVFQALVDSLTLKK